MNAGEHKNLVKVVAQLDQSHEDRSDAEKRLGLVMQLIPSHYMNLGMPPSLQTCTRDTFKEGTVYTVTTVAKVAVQMADVMTHLYARGISHGDVYAHNTMINKDGDVLFGDFGAATNLASLPDAQTALIERVEVRAFGNLLDDLLGLCVIDFDVEAAERFEQETALFAQLSEVKERCLLEEVSQRPCFSEILALLVDG